jgi:hypothetical protein
MLEGGGPGARSPDRRQWPRLKLSVPVQFGKGSGGKGELLYFSAGESLNIGSNGVLFATNEPGPFELGEILALSIAIPWEARRKFPFSRIVGFGRIRRVEEEPRTEQVSQRRVALEFCEGETMLLGAIV